MHDLFKTTNKGEVTIWYTGDKTCTSCQKEILHHTAFCILDWNPKNFTRQILCEECVNNKKINPVVYSQDRFIIYVVDDIPSNAMPVILRPPIMKQSKDDLTVFEGNKVISDKTTSNCKYANTFFGEGEEHGFTIGKVDNNLLSKDVSINYDQAINILEEYKEGVKK